MSSRLFSLCFVLVSLSASSLFSSLKQAVSARLRMLVHTNSHCKYDRAALWRCAGLATLGTRQLFSEQHATSNKLRRAENEAELGAAIDDLRCIIAFGVTPPSVHNKKNPSPHHSQTTDRQRLVMVE